MTRIIVEPTYVYHLFDRHPGGWTDEFRRVWDALKCWVYRELKPSDLQDVSVAEVLEACRAEVIRLLRERCPELLEHRRRALEAVGRLYGYPEFTSSVENAAASLSPCGVLPHGKLAGQPVTLADECSPALVLGLGPLANFANEGRSVEMFRTNCVSMMNIHHAELRQRTLELLRLAETQLRCHFCDSLSAVSGRAGAFRADLEKQLDLEDEGIAKVWREKLLWKKCDDELVLGVLPEGFPAYSGLRQMDPQLPVLAAQALLRPAAVRRGVGVPTMRGIIPAGLWASLTPPVHAFILEAAEAFALPKPLLPRHPEEEELEGLSEPRWPMGLGDYLIRYDPEQYDREHPEILGLVGIRRAVDQYRLNTKPPAPGESPTGQARPPGWIAAVMELKSALYDVDIEQSLRVQPVLNLYPLHKRILGLVEHVLLPLIKGKHNLEGWAATVWARAFTKSPSGPKLDETFDDLATLETAGNWLIEANEQGKQDETGPLDLADLMDKIVGSMVRPRDGWRVPDITLAPRSPQEQARQLMTLARHDNSQADKKRQAEENKSAACLTLYLGKLALTLRNAVEHGSEQVETKCLRIECNDMWKGESRGSFSYVKEQAKDLKWRRRCELPKEDSVPEPAKAFRLTPRSLQRCLVLLSLVLHAGISHLQLPLSPATGGT